MMYKVGAAVALIMNAEVLAAEFFGSDFGGFGGESLSSSIGGFGGIGGIGGLNFGGFDSGIRGFEQNVASSLTHGQQPREQAWSGQIGDATINKYVAETDNGLYEAEEICKPGDTSVRCRTYQVQQTNDPDGKGTNTKIESSNSWSSSSSSFGDIGSLNGLGGGLGGIESLGGGLSGVFGSGFGGLGDLGGLSGMGVEGLNKAPSAP